MNCGEFSEIAEIALDKRASAGQKMALSQHMSACKACDRKFRELSEFRDLLDSGMKKIYTGVKASSGKSELLNRIASRRRKTWVFKLALAAAAAVVIVSGALVVSNVVLALQNKEILERLSKLENEKQLEVQNLEAEVKAYADQLNAMYARLEDPSERRAFAVLSSLIGNGAGEADPYVLIKSGNPADRAAAFKALVRSGPDAAPRLERALAEADSELSREQISALIDIVKNKSVALARKPTKVVSISRSSSENGRVSQFEFYQFSDGGVKISIAEDSEKTDIDAPDMAGLIEKNRELCVRYKVIDENGRLLLGLPIRSLGKTEADLVGLIKSDNLKWDSAEPIFRECFKNFASARIKNEGELESYFRRVQEKAERFRRASGGSSVRAEARAGFEDRVKRIEELEGKINTLNNARGQLDVLKSYLNRN